MNPDDIRELSQFTKELNKETDRGLPLVGAALLDFKLLETLKVFFSKKNIAKKLLNDGNAPLGTFASRIDLCYALSLIDKFEYDELTVLRKVRNEFAHAKHGTTFQNRKIKQLCLSLKSELPDDPNYPKNDPRLRYTNSIICLSLSLYYRPDFVKKERRESKTWYDKEERRWRSVKDEKPPKDVPFMAMGKGLK